MQEAADFQSESLLQRIKPLYHYRIQRMESGNKAYQQQEWSQRTGNYLRGQRNAANKNFLHRSKHQILKAKRYEKIHVIRMDVMRRAYIMQHRRFLRVRQTGSHPVAERQRFRVYGSKPVHRTFPNAGMGFADGYDCILRRIGSRPDICQPVVHRAGGRLLVSETNVNIRPYRV